MVPFQRDEIQKHMLVVERGKRDPFNDRECIGLERRGNKGGANEKECKTIRKITMRKRVQVKQERWNTRLSNLGSW